MSQNRSMICSLLVIFIFLISCQSKDQSETVQQGQEASGETLMLETVSQASPRNVIFILSDDHRYDYMGFTGKVPWLNTPHMDRMAAEGAYFPNAFVTTSLCSPSRASILTGMYTHSHTVVDNQAPVPENLIFFPKYLQNAGYETAFFGKWHMGDEQDDPRPGFDHWESFKGQGVYYNPELNINGNRVQYEDSTYISDLLTDHVIEWLNTRESEKPYFVYLSHKAVHAMFKPAQRHMNQYDQEEIIYPPSYNTSELPVKGKREDPDLEPYGVDSYYGPGRMPDWQKMQRESWHGVDYMYHGQLDFETFYKRYLETLMGVDESIGRILDYLEQAGQDQSTMVIYMGDNGFSFGEHGLIDKRQFYEESVKVPFLVRCPEILEGGQTIENMVQNVDVAPTVLQMAGLKAPEYMVGRSILPVLTGEAAEWRDKIFYEYYWEYAYPQTPTMHGVRTDRYKLIRYHGVWDTNEFYDLQEDPHEMNNLIASPEHQDLILDLTNQIYDWLESSQGMQIPLKRIDYPHRDHRNQGLY
ncbi:MAG: sulfatase family protein [Candidatus Cyclobacteriaceae bacterium M3_2C_046]